MAPSATEGEMRLRKQALITTFSAPIDAKCLQLNEKYPAPPQSLCQLSDCLMVCWGCLSVGARICFTLKMNGRAGLVLPIGEAAVEVKFAPQRYDASAAVGRGSSGRFALMEVLHRYA